MSRACRAPRRSAVWRSWTRSRTSWRTASSPPQLGLPPGLALVHRPATAWSRPKTGSVIPSWTVHMGSMLPRGMTPAVTARSGNQSVAAESTRRSAAWTGERGDGQVRAALLRVGQRHRSAAEHRVGERGQRARRGNGSSSGWTRSRFTAWSRVRSSPSSATAPLLEAGPLELGAQEVRLRALADLVAGPRHHLGLGPEHLQLREQRRAGRGRGAGRRRPAPPRR